MNFTLRPIVVLLFILCAGLATASEAVRYSDFGAKGDGKTDDFEAIAKAHAHANEKDLPVVAQDGATYYIGGADRTISVETSTHFGEAKFIIDDTKLENHRAHVFEVRSKHKLIRLKDVESIRQGQTRIDVSLPGPCLMMVRDDNVRRFIRRGNNRNDGAPQTDVFLVDGKGNVDPATPIIWDFKKVTRLEAMPLDEDVLMIKGGHFTTIANQAESKYQYHARGISIRRSNVEIEGLRHFVRGEGPTGAPYSGFIAISNCAHVVVRNTVLTGRKTYGTIGAAGKPVSMGSYGISISSAANVSLIGVTQSNDIMDRSRWGIISTNFSKNLIYDGCKLSRFDAHQGVTNATIRNSTLGYMALRLTGFGTFTIENSTVQAPDFIALRSDYGSTWNGDIIIRNCRFIPTSSDIDIIDGSNDGRHDFGYTCHLPTRVIIDGLHIEDAKVAKANGYKGPSVFNNPNPGFKKGVKLPHPQVITREVSWRGVRIDSGKPMRLSDNKELFAGVKVHAQEAK